MPAKRKQSSKKKVLKTPTSNNSSYSKLAIASLIAALFNIISVKYFAFPLLSIVLGIFALVKIRKNKQKGKLLAWLGISISSLWILIMFPIFLIALFLASISGVKLNESTSQAIQDMTPQERQYFDNTLGKINSDSTVYSINEMLGKPYQSDKLLMITHNYYYCPNTLYPKCTVRIDFTYSKATRVIWGEPYRFNLIKKYN